MPELKPPVPLLRIFDEAKAREFYVEFLGFEVEFEHRFGDDFPIYLSVRRGDCVLHLTEHHGDATPGAHVRIGVAGLDDYCRGLGERAYRNAKPGMPQAKPWGTREIGLTDPFGNRLTFVETAVRPAAEG
ncbi:MAG: VOC family protein [Pseudomonadota bacterium]|nr:VOC family protein [Pseudomonadota bacterium]